MCLYERLIRIIVKKWTNIIDETFRNASNKSMISNTQHIFMTLSS